MVNFTSYTLFTTIIVSSVFIVLFLFIYKNKYVITGLQVRLLILSLVFLFLRLVLPFEFETYTVPISSIKLLPTLVNVLNLNIVSNYYISLSFFDLLCVVWFLGSFLFIFKYIKTYIGLYDKTRHIPTSNDDAIINCIEKFRRIYKCKFPVKVIVHEKIICPAEFGFFRQTILLPSAEYSQQDLEFIIFHELMHFKNHSNWIKLFTALFKSVFWWNPIAHTFDKHIDFLNEVYVDISVVNTDEKKKTTDYLKCINNILDSNEKHLQYDNCFVNSLVDLSNEKALLRRFEIITMPKKRSSQVQMTLLLLAVILSFNLLSYKFVFQTAYRPPDEDLLDVDFTPQNSYIILEDGVYYLYYNDEPLICVEDLSLYSDLPVITK